MRESSRKTPEEIGLYLTPEHSCGYFSERSAQTVFLDPLARPDEDLFAHLMALGFRRSGNHIYRPHCRGCRACVPVRVRARNFRPSRSQRRCWKRNADAVSVTLKPARFDPDHHALYLSYTATRHANGGMADADETRFMEFITTHWCRSHFVEFRHRGRLMAVAITDEMPDALSAVYTFFDPALSAISPGVFAILWQIQEVRRRGLSHLYLGYWIRDNKKMLYKEHYRPIEVWNGHDWKSYGPGEELPDFY